ncbi:ribosome biogenesis protein BOP1, putative [Plasmodium malariae]|uniref:Ribosome biogenesis protein BOP1 homolog n=1 Tax=Plasmodium malariae TaxID=5858 RepID=A0A1D3TD98_PLAMA|nr:ribosome biogenesis protein BOP1, putative [Plasmodium malariae]SCP02878.1 ribosome biogenesis protein BOP1, putative [Plasmodium malariae]
MKKKNVNKSSTFEHNGKEEGNHLKKGTNNSSCCNRNSNRSSNNSNRSGSISNRSGSNSNRSISSSGGRTWRGQKYLESTEKGNGKNEMFSIGTHKVTADTDIKVEGKEECKVENEDHLKTTEQEENFLDGCSISNKSKNKIVKKETDYEDTIASDINNLSVKSINTEVGNNIYVNEEIDESDDEYNLNTLGNFDLKNYEDFDIIGYDIKGNKIYKKDENAIDDFIESKTGSNAWKKIKDKKNNRIIELTDADLQIIRSIRENRAAKYIDYSNYIYENDKEEYKLPSKLCKNLKNKGSEGDKKKVLKLMKYLIDKEKHPERYIQKENEDNMLYDLWNNKIYDEFNNINEINLPNILPGHKYSYNPPPELLYNSSEKRNILKNNKDAFIPQNFEKIRNIEYYKKTYFDLYQRCLDIYLCSRSLKNVLHINKEDLLPKLPSTKSLKPYPQYPFIKYITNEGDMNSKNRYCNNKNNHFNSIDINEHDHIVYIIQSNKLYIFDILTSYNVATIDLMHYFKFKMVKKKSLEDLYNNMMIKVNKSYSVVAISWGNFILLFHYESYVPSIRSGSENIEEIYRRNGIKKSKNSSGNINGKEYKNEQNDGNEKDSHTSLSNLQDEEEEEGNFSEDNVMGDETDIELDQIDEGDISDDSNEIEINKNEEVNDEHAKKKCVQLNRNMVYFKTKGLLSVFHNNFKNSEEYSYSPDIDVKWIHINSNDKKIKYCVGIKHEGEIKNFSWNGNGNYLSVTCMRNTGQYHYCYLHHIKSMKSMKLIKKYKHKRGDIIQTLFFPRSPYFSVAFENSIIIYNLKAKTKKERIVKKLRGVQNITYMDVHTNESYVLVSDVRGNVFVFDLDLSSNPYKKFHLQECSLKKVEFHKTYNLFYSLSSNGTVNLFYSKFFQDYITNPILLPIKELSNESKIADLVWSGRKPWLFVHTEGNFSALYT